MTDEALRQGLRWSALCEISSRVTHETNNLLAGILGQAELGVLSGEPARMRTSLESIVRNARELKSVTERLLAFNRQMEPCLQNVNLLEIFRTLNGLLERAFTKAGIHVDRHYGDVPMTWCDPGGALPPLLFILRHALDTLRHAGGGTAVLEAVPEPPDVVFSVRISAAPGTRLDDPPGRRGDLSYDQARELAKAAGGSLQVDREESGWTLSCRLPIQKAPAASSQRDAAHRDGEAVSLHRDADRDRGALMHDRDDRASEPEVDRGRSDPRSRGLSVLVVEDEVAIRELVQEVLQGDGYLVTAEADAASALATFRQGSFDVVLTDVSMPGMDGLTLVRELRAVDPKAAVVVITGRATDEAARAALAAGARRILRKPFELSELRAIVHSLLGDPPGAVPQPSAPREGRNILVS